MLLKEVKFILCYVWIESLCFLFFVEGNYVSVVFVSSDLFIVI